MFALFLAAPALAVPIPLGEEVSLDVGGLVQTQAVLTEDGAPDGESLGFDLFVRRARLGVSGIVAQRFAFTFVVDSPNLGKNGDWTGRMLVQDALVSAKVSRAFAVDAGLILLPFGHHGVQSAGTLDSLDYHSTVMLYPADSTQVWRDAGFQLRGLLFKDRLHYRLGVFNGVEGLVGSGVNAQDWPRFAGQLRLNLLGTEDRTYFAGIYFPDRPMLSLGVSGMAQPGAVGTGDDASAWVGAVGDVFADVPVGKSMELVVQAGVVHYIAGADSVTSGTGGFAELGYRIGPIEPIVGGELFLSDADHAHSEVLRFGLNTWIKRHTANVKAEVTRTVTGGLLGDVDPTWSGTLQTQVAF